MPPWPCRRPCGATAREVRRTHGVEVQIRVGLNSGEVVVRAIGNDLHMDYSAIGQTTHLAARMEQLATPGSIRLTAETLRLVEGLVQVTAAGAGAGARGWQSPVEVFELVGASTLRRRLQAAAARGLTRFVGRQTEIEALQQALARAEAGHGQVVAMVGEAGVGKSRLVYEFVHSHRTQGWLVLESASVSYGKATPYFPVLDLLKRYVHVEERDDPRTIRAKVTGQVLTLDEALQETIPALLCAAGRPAGRQPVSDSSTRRSAASAPWRRSSACCCAKARCNRCCWSLRICTGSMPRPRPCSIAWSRACRRPGSCSWSTTARSISTAGAVRPTTRNCGSIRCRPPAPTNFLQALLGDDPSLAPLTRLLIARTEGNPFFLEESVRTLVETGVLVGERGAYRLAQSLPDHAGTGHGAGGAGGAHRPAATGGEAPAPDRRGHRH